MAFFGPALVLLTLFLFLPMLLTLGFSFTDYFALNPELTHFVGLENYEEIVFDETFHKVLMNTIIYTVLFVGLTMVLAIIIAVWLNGSRQKKLNNMVEACIFTPHVISMVSVSIVFL